jgi:hypothetical protein
MYTIARTILGWSDKEFFESTPGKYFAVLQKYGEIKQKLLQPQERPLVGKDAINALTQVASYVS